MTSLALVVVFLVLLSHQVASEGEQRYFVHPYFGQVSSLPDKTQFDNRPDIIYKSLNESVCFSKTGYSNTLIQYRAFKTDFKLYSYKQGSFFESGLGSYFDVLNEIGTFTQPVSQERQRIRGYTNINCLDESFHAFELLARYKENPPMNAVGVGIGQGPGVCIFKYHAGGPQKGIFGNIESYLRINGPLTAYRVTSMAGEAFSVNSSAMINFVDEAGYGYKYILSHMPDKNYFLSYHSSYSLSAHALEGQFGSQPVKNENFKSWLIGKKDPKQKMQAHFKHSFTEAITLYKDKLIYARGINQPNQARLLVASASSKNPELDFLFGELLESSSNTEKFVGAIEMYDLAGRVILHLGITSRETDHMLHAEADYYYCNIASLDVFKRDNRFYTLKPISDEKDIACSKGKFYGKSLPIDIVHMPHCKTTVFFHDHWYHEIKDNQPLNWGSEPKKIFINWMTDPINAIMYNNRRLFLFLRGSDVLISKPTDSCSWENIEFEAPINTQSQLILNFKNDPMANQGPLFLSGRAFHSGSTQSREFEAFPPIDATVKPVERDRRIIPDFPYPAPTTTPSISSTNIPSTTPSTDPSTTTPKPKSKPGSNTSIIIVATVIVLILAAGLFAIYYFCMSGSEEPPVGVQKSRALQNRKTIRSEPEKKPIPALTHTSTSTVRSDIVVPSSIASKSVIKSSPKASKSAGSSSKSRSPGLPVSKTVSSKRSSPNLSAKTLSRSKKMTKSKSSPAKTT